MELAFGSEGRVPGHLYVCVGSAIKGTTFEYGGLNCR